MNIAFRNSGHYNYYSYGNLYLFVQICITDENLNDIQNKIILLMSNIQTGK